jgi:FkbM family methyltransferase
MLIEFLECQQLIKQIHNTSPSTVLHIGAHVGEEASAYFSSNARHITWFEANAALIPHLRKHIECYPIDQQIVNCALWAENQKIKFNVTNNLQSSSAFEMGTHADHYPEIAVTESRFIDAYRFDSIVSSGLVKVPSFDFVNIDTQGAELAILKGFGALLGVFPILGIYLEVNKEPLYAGIPLIEEIDQFLFQSGFLRILTKWTKEGWGDALYIKQRIDW